MNIDKIIEKWVEYHSLILDEYSKGNSINEVMQMFRTQMKNILEVIDDLKQIKNNLVLNEIIDEYLTETSNHTTVKMKFKDAPVGARFKYLDGTEGIWVKINSYPKGQFSDGRGLICSWHGNTDRSQSFCCFTDSEDGGKITFDTEIELI